METNLPGGQQPHPQPLGTGQSIKKSSGIFGAVKSIISKKTTDDTAERATNASKAIEGDIKGSEKSKKKRKYSPINKNVGAEKTNNSLIITSGNKKLTNNFSNLIKHVDSLGVVTSFLTGRDHKDHSALASVNKQAFTSAGRQLLLIKEQELNHLYEDLFGKITKSPIVAKMQNDFEIAKQLHSGPSLEKIEAMRENIASHFSHNTFESIISIIEQYPNMDKPLKVKIFEMMDLKRSGPLQLTGTLGKDFSVHTVMAYLEALNKDLIDFSDSKKSYKELHFNFNSHIDRPMALAIADVIKNNEQITSLILYSNNWDASTLEPILKAVNASDSIEYIEIKDQAAKPLGGKEIATIASNCLRNRKWKVEGSLLKLD